MEDRGDHGQEEVEGHKELEQHLNDCDLLDNKKLIGTGNCFKSINGTDMKEM